MCVLEGEGAMEESMDRIFSCKPGCQKEEDTHTPGRQIDGFLIMI